MATIDHTHVAALLHRGATAATTKEKGDALERLICYILARFQEYLSARGIGGTLLTQKK